MKTNRKLPSTKTGRARLLKLANLLEVDAKNRNGIKFNLQYWGRTNPDLPPVSCGTEACAMGLAVVSGAFKRAGLRNVAPGSRIEPGIKGARSFGAAVKLFAISFEESKYLFAADQYPHKPRIGAAGERAVAKRIRNFVAGKAA